MDSRKMLCDQLRAIESKIEGCQQNDEPYDMYVNETNSLTETIQSQTQQISDAGVRSSTDAGSCCGVAASDPDCQILSCRLVQ
uniref:Uncharacterized protein n=1 Tax=Trichobilharzia regenti TaxID=157069 RepID=A0AA85JH95_TRIRE|nr:unnamed protein product [Trichobilharzia regenti]